MTNREKLIERVVGTVNAQRPDADDLDRLVEETIDELVATTFPSVAVTESLVRTIRRHSRLGWYLR